MDMPTDCKKTAETPGKPCCAPAADAACDSAPCNPATCAELEDRDLAAVSGGACSDCSVSTGLLRTIQNILHSMGVDFPDDYVRSLIAKGGSVLRDWAKFQTDNHPNCNMLPVFD